MTGRARRAWRMRRLSARELVESRAEALREAGGDEASLGLWCNAAILSRALRTRRGRRFRSAREVLAAFSAGEIARLAGQYGALAHAEALSPAGDARAHEAMLERLSAQPYERLKWRVLRACGALPTEARAREMTDADYLYCALHLSLDDRERLERLCPECRAAAEEARCPACGRAILNGEGGVNAAFDIAEFTRRRDGGGDT